jgi:hypothetical protein
VVKPDSLAERLGLSRYEPTADGLDVAAHTRNWLDAIRSGGETAASSRVMRRSHVACHAAALSWILKRKLTIDPATEAFVGDDEANGLIHRPVREAWRLG